MGFFQWIKLYSVCFQMFSFRGLWLCFRFMIGDLKLDETMLKSCNFPVGGSDAQMAACSDLSAPGMLHPGPSLPSPG